MSEQRVLGSFKIATKSKVLLGVICSLWNICTIGLTPDKGVARTPQTSRIESSETTIASKKLLNIVAKLSWKHWYLIPNVLRSFCSKTKFWINFRSALYHNFFASFLNAFLRSYCSLQSIYYAVHVRQAFYNFLYLNYHWPHWNAMQLWM